MRFGLIISVVACLGLCVVGCGADDHEHDHAAGEDHGDGHDHAGHHHDPPHGGTLVVFGSETAHLEFVLESVTGKLEAWVLDGSAENGVRIPQREIELSVAVGGKREIVKLQARANKLSGETPGDTSEFEAISKALEGASKFEATVVSLTVKGTEFKDVKFPFPAGNE